ncbi:MAG: hypothetical protein M4D80_14470 [Myxococcota bacterium]|nr:hypothetical protein [Myxococcota bacterium]
MASNRSPDAAASIRLPGLWVVIAGVHIAAAAYAWQQLPHGFGADHPRFWTNQVLPFAIVALGAACLFGLWRRRARLAAVTISVFVGLHVAMAAAWIVVFPITGKRPALMTAAIAVVLCACAIASLWRARGMRVPVAIGAVIGLLIGSALPWSQRGPDAGTHPAPARQLGQPTEAATPALPPWLRASPHAGALSIEIGLARIELHPLLTFISRSPDRGWTLLADAEDRIGPTRSYAGTSVAAATTTYHYAGDEPAIVRVAALSDEVLHVEAETVLATAVYSHLNHFCAMQISGHRRLFLAFSAIPTQRIEVTYSEYPVGRPSRFAYVDAARELHVVEAESGEKGPFTELARGPLPAGAPLGITLFDEQQPIARIELADFASQASTQLSPTAGWGVPENAIEFSLNGDRPDATARLYITLAGTSVGRGFDSVGHAPGLYRNRVEIRRLPPP